jgi:hypothetical protein
MKTILQRKVEEGRAKLPVERQQEIDANITQKREEFKLWNLPKVLYEAANENKDRNLHFEAIAEWDEIVKQRDFKRKQALNRKDGLKGSLKLSKHAKSRMTQRGITMWDMANGGVTIICSGKNVKTVYRK